MFNLLLVHFFNKIYISKTMSYDKYQGIIAKKDSKESLKHALSLKIHYRSAKIPTDAIAAVFQKHTQILGLIFQENLSFFQ